MKKFKAKDKKKIDDEYQVWCLKTLLKESCNEPLLGFVITQLVDETIRKCKADNDAT